MATANPDTSEVPNEGEKEGDTGAGSGGEGEGAESDRAFECNICLDTARDAVVSMCGHLFCWPCLHQWLETRPNRQICPVCKVSLMLFKNEICHVYLIQAGISKDKVIPLYGRGNTDGKDPRYNLLNIPTRFDICMLSLGKRCHLDLKDKDLNQPLTIPSLVLGLEEDNQGDSICHLG